VFYYVGMAKRGSRIPPFPNGWFRVAYTEDLNPGDVKPLRYFGRDFVLFRTEAGDAKILDAFCPHLGAHLGHGGKVVGDCIECPFHAWKLKGDGSVGEIPYAKKIPAKAGTEGMHVREHSGLIMMWHHAEGAEPDWEVPEFQEYTNPKYMPYRGFGYDIRTHIQDVVENSVDHRHLTHVHGLVEAEPEITDSENNPFKVRIEMKVQTIGKKSAIMPGTIEIENYGVGISPARVTIGGMVKYLFLATVTPVELDTVDTKFAIALKRMAPNEETNEKILNRIVEDEAEQVARDLPIWNNKVFRDPPLLSENDSAIGPLRRWARKYYSAPDAEAAE